MDRADVIGAVSGWIGGMVSFRGALAASSGVCRMLRISANFPLISTACGVAGVFFGGVAAASSYIVVNNFTSAYFKDRKRIQTTWDVVYFAGKSLPSQEDWEFAIPASGIFSVLAFNGLFKGQFRSVVPSDLFKPGGFARGCVETELNVEVTVAQKNDVHYLGNAYGCHSCGTYALQYIADHIPPTSMVNKGLTFGRTQKLYPHCGTCAIKQGAAVFHGKRTLVNPAFVQLRPEYIWLPIPVAFTSSNNIKN
jgi:hypothetical protein